MMVALAGFTGRISFGSKFQPLLDPNLVSQAGYSLEFQAAPCSGGSWVPCRVEMVIQLLYREQLLSLVHLAIVKESKERKILPKTGFDHLLKQAPYPALFFLFFSFFPFSPPL